MCRASRVAARPSATTATEPGAGAPSGALAASAVAATVLATALLATTAGPASAQRPGTEARALAQQMQARVTTAQQLRDRALQGNVAYEIVEALTTMGPRLAGTDVEHRAAAWGAAWLRQHGFENVRIEEFPLLVWTRGREEAWVVAPQPQPLVVTMLGGSPPTPAAGIEAEVVLFETYEGLLEAAPGSLAGRIAVVLQETPRTQEGAGYGSTSPMRFRGPVEAAARGAVAYLLRSLGTHDHRFAHTGATQIVENTIPSFAMSPPDAEQLVRVARSGPVRVRLLGTPPAPVQGRSQNVIAEVRGRERPDEVIVIGGHVDSWDLGTGALDDAAGIGITTAAAKLIAELPQRPRRTIRVVWWGAEEVSQPDGGLAGARHYATTRGDEIDRHVIASESDFGAGPIYSLSLPAGLADSELRREAIRVLAPLGIFFDPQPATGGGPDVIPLVQLGVPAFRLNQDGTDYFNFHHTSDDVIERIDRRYLDQNVAAWAALLWLIADSDVEFRAAAAAAVPHDEPSALTQLPGAH
jgi:carboxypeptidase Q